MAAAAVAVLGLACTSRAQQFATVTWVNQGVNYNIPGTVAYHNYSAFPCSGLGLMLTSENGTTLPTHQTGFGVFPNTYIPDSSVYFCPNYSDSFACCNPYRARLDLPIGSFPAGAPEFIGENMTMNWGPFQKSTNAAFPTADTFVVVSLSTQDGAWTGSTTQWFQSFVVPSRCFGRMCVYNVTEYKALGGTGTLTALLP